MNTSHAPGPWFITEGPTYGQTTTLKVDSPRSTDRVHGMVICERMTSTLKDLQPMHKEIRANMALIAAAPDLLAALKKAEHIISKLAGWSGNDLSELDKEFGYFAIPEAIAKATTPNT